MDWTAVWELLGKGLSFGLAGTVVGWWLKTRLERSIGFEYDVRLEQYRQAAALATEVARERVRVLGDIWRELAKFEQLCVRQKLSMGRLFWVEVHNQNGNPPEATLPTSLFPMYEALEAIGGVELAPEATKRFFDQMEPENQALLEQGRVVTELIGLNRFWLGMESQKALRKYFMELSTAFMNLTPVGADREAFRKAVAQLKSSQGEAERLLPQLMIAARAV